MINLSMVIEHHARLTPERLAIVSGGTTLSFGALNAHASRVAGALRAMGVRPGDHVALSCPNTVHFPIAYYGILKCGAAVVPLNVLLKPREIAQHLEDSNACAYLCFEGTFELPLAQMGFEAFKRTECAKHFIVMTAARGAASPVAGAPTLDELVAGETDVFETVLRSPDDTAVLLYTSGTTGRAKGAELTHANMLFNAMVARDMAIAQQGTAPAKALAVLPLFHSFGQTSILNAHLLQGNCVVLLPRFDAAATMAIIVSEGVTAFAGVPTMYWAMLRHAESGVFDIATIKGQLRACCSGGAPMPVEILREFERVFEVAVLEGYGLSETAPVATFNQVGRPSKPGSVGLPVWGCEVRVVDEADNSVAPGELGEVVIRGHNVMKGYFRQPEITAEVMRNGWFHSGDVGYFDDEGYLYIADRIKDMIIRGGLNVYPREIEEMLFTHPAVSMAAVIGVPHEEHGEEIKAFVIRKAGASVTESELIAWAREIMAAFKYPRFVEFVDALPMNATGKVLKRELRVVVAALKR